MESRTKDRNFLDVGFTTWLTSYRHSCEPFLIPQGIYATNEWSRPGIINYQVVGLLSIQKTKLLFSDTS
jgi:hypothetical protein